MLNMKAKNHRFVKSKHPHQQTKYPSSSYKCSCVQGIGNLKPEFTPSRNPSFDMRKLFFYPILNDDDFNVLSATSIP